MFPPDNVGADELGFSFGDLAKAVINPLGAIRQYVPGASQFIPQFDPVQSALNAIIPSQQPAAMRPPSQAIIPPNYGNQWQAATWAAQRQAQALAEQRARRAAQLAMLRGQLSQVAPQTSQVGRDVVFPLSATIDALTTTATATAQPTEGLIPRALVGYDYDGTSTASAAGTVLLQSLAIGSQLQNVGGAGTPLAMIAPSANNVVSFRLSYIPTAQPVQAVFTRTVAPGAGASRVCVLTIQGQTAA